MEISSISAIPLIQTVGNIFRCMGMDNVKQNR
jgi:hypothetical protein